MGSKTCMNKSCGITISHEWKRGWALRSGGYALLCYTCGSAYENSLYCDSFHLEDPGWRECNYCNKRLHCGCIASKSLVEFLDFGGVGCASCAKGPGHLSVQTDEISNGFGSIPLNNNARDMDSNPLGNQSTHNTTLDEGRLAQLCRLMEANEPRILCQSEMADKNGDLVQYGQEEVIHPIREAGTAFLTASQSSVLQSKFSNGARSILDMRDLHGSLAQPSLNVALGASSGSTSFSPYASGSGVFDGKDQENALQFQLGQRARPILPKPSKPSFPGGLEMCKTPVSDLRIARPPAEGRGKSQLLPRYWPRITDQELQQLSGDLNSNIVPLFEKILSASDAGRIGRLVLPKACAEAYFPPISQSDGIPLRIQDVKGREWTFQFRFWPNNNSRMYVLEGVTPCIQAMQLRAGDTITFSRIDPGGKLVVGFRKATNNSLDSQDAQTSAFSNSAALAETSFSADVNTGWNKGENDGGRTNGDELQQATPEKKRTRNIGHKTKRLLMHSDDVLELRLTWEEAQDLLRPPPSVKPNIVTIEDHEFEEYEEPPVFGKRTIFSDQPSRGQEQWAQCDDCSKWRKLPGDALLPPKWTCVDNIWDSRRSLCSAPEEMSPKDLDNLLRASKDLKKRRTLERHKPSPECEPSGLDALASAAVLGDIAEPSVGATTKHPRHRPGCTCIVCIQPPSGKGKHKPTCTCNVCMTVKRRFKTLMLRKKKRQSEREAEISNKDKNEWKDDFETIGSMSDAVLHLNGAENERFTNGNQSGSVETSGGGIDLNCHPDRQDLPVDLQEVSMNLADRHIKQNVLPNLLFERPSSTDSCLQSQNNGESLRRLSDESFLGSVGWNHE